MGTCHYGVLSYGYDLGNDEAARVAQVDTYGSFSPDWINKDEEGYPTETLPEAVTRRLYEAIPGVDLSQADSSDQGKPVWEHYGVRILGHGWLAEGDVVSYALIAHQEEVDGGDCLPLDLTSLDLQRKKMGYDEKLASALEILRITPTQENPAWLLMASR